MVIAYGSGRSSPGEPIIGEEEALGCLCSDTNSKILWSNWLNEIPVRCEREK